MDKKRTSLVCTRPRQDSSSSGSRWSAVAEQQQQFGPGLAGWPRRYGHGHDKTGFRQAGRRADDQREGRGERREVKVKFSKVVLAEFDVRSKSTHTSTHTTYTRSHSMHSPSNNEKPWPPCTGLSWPVLVRSARSVSCLCGGPLASGDGGLG